MKRIITVLLTLFVFATLSAQGIKAHLKNGSVITYTYSELDYLEAYEYISDEECLNLSPQEAVDLGLPSGLKWASSNIGADMPEISGDKFAWGETKPKSEFSWKNYQLCNGDLYYLKKYNNSKSYGTIDNKYILEPEDDAAHYNWGGTWRMPTKTEIDELISRCTWKEIETPNGLYGWRVTGPNRQSIFIRYGQYWTSNIVNNKAYAAYFLDLTWSKPGNNDERRCEGFYIRPVCP